MTDFGTPEERAAALRVAIAAKNLNSAISDAAAIGVQTEIDVIILDQIGHPQTPIIQVGMERRTMILPEEIGDVDA